MVRTTEEALPQKITSHPAHPHHKLIKEEAPENFTCQGCGRKGNKGSFWYKCDKGCNIKLHACCAVKVLVTHHRFGANTLRYQEIAETNIKKFCRVCGGEVPGFVYHCPREDTKDDAYLHPCCAHRVKGSCLCKNPNAKGRSKEPYAKHKTPK